jgi:hypothetical protein
MNINIGLLKLLIDRNESLKMKFIEDDRASIVESFIVNHKDYVYVRRRIEQCIRYQGRKRNTGCLVVCGKPNSGKSTLAEELPITFPDSNLEDGTAVRPVLMIEAPTKPTSKNLSGSLLYALGDPLFNKGDDEDRTRRLCELLPKVGVRAVVIDEFQQFIDQGTSKIIHHAADTLKRIISNTNVSVIVFGLPHCVGVLQQNGQLRRRFKNKVELPQFDWFNEGDRIEFVSVLHAIYKKVGIEFSIPKIYKDDLAFRSYIACGGLIGYLIDTLSQAVINAIDNDTSEISLDDLKLAHHEAVFPNSETPFLNDPFGKDLDLTNEDMKVFSAESLKIYESLKYV